MKIFAPSQPTTNPFSLFPSSSSPISTSPPSPPRYQRLPLMYCQTTHPCMGSTQAPAAWCRVRPGPRRRPKPTRRSAPPRSALVQTRGS
eukprot:191954-Chlamydomonas_euryale.AAC.1